MGIKFHDKSVTSAWLRGGAGFMKDRRAPRGGARNEQADWLAEWEAEEEDAQCEGAVEECDAEDR